jgi:hypothetical protein
MDISSFSWILSRGIFSAGGEIFDKKSHPEVAGGRESFLV